MLLGCGEDEDHVRWRFLQSLEKGIEGGGTEHVDLVDDEHLVFAYLRRDAGLLHQGLDLLVRVTGRLVGGRVERVLCHLALVGLVLIVVGLIFGVCLAEVVGIILHALQQLVVLVQLGLVDLELAFQVILLHVDIRALDVGHEGALVHIAALRNIHLGNGAGITGHDIGFIAGLHGACVLADINAVGMGAPHHQKQHDAAVLQIRKVLNFNRHNYLVSIKTSTTASSSS